MMRARILPFTFAASLASMGQVHADHRVVLTATDSTLRAVEGLAPAAAESALITAGGSQSGRYLWTQATGTGMAVTLTADPPCTAYASGLTLRFMPEHPGSGPVTFNLNSLGAKHVYRSDGSQPSIGQLEPGTVIEVVYVDTAFFLQGRDAATCPAGFLPVNGEYCVQTNDTLNVSVYTATRWCMDRGARLCTWDQYIYACTSQNAQLQGLFDDWEWIDDTSDHTHTGNQVGRYQCRTQRSWGALEDPNNYARVRCCYNLR